MSAEVKAEVTGSNQKEEKIFCVVKLRRVSHGVKIYCRCKQAEEFFRGIAEETGRVHASDWEDIRGYRILELPSVEYMKLSHWGGYLVVGGVPNLSFLRAVGVGDGVEFVARGVYSRQMLDLFVSRAKEALQRFYADFLKDYKVDVIVRKLEDVANQ